MDPRWASAATPAAEVNPAKERLQRFSWETAPPLRVPPGPEPTAYDASPVLIPRNQPDQRTSDARRRRSGRFVKSNEPHPEAHAGRSRAIRPKSRAKSPLGTATSASWKTRYFACDTTFAPILISLSRSVVSVQCFTALGSTSWRRKFARLYARANNCNRAWLSLNRRHDSFVHFTACLPSLIHCSAVPRAL